MKAQDGAYILLKLEFRSLWSKTAISITTDENISSIIQFVEYLAHDIADRGVSLLEIAGCKFLCSLVAVQRKIFHPKIRDRKWDTHTA